MRRGTLVVLATALVLVLALSGGALAGKPADPGKGKANGSAAAGEPADKGGGKPSALPHAQEWQGGWIHDYTEAASSQAQSDYYIVVFADPPAASYTGGIRGLKPTKPVRGQKLSSRSEEVRAYADYLRSVHANYRAFLNGRLPALRSSPSTSCPRTRSPSRRTARARRASTAPASRASTRAGSTARR